MIQCRICFSLFLFLNLFTWSEKTMAQEGMTREELIEKYNYNWISEFSEGKALVYNNNECYVINNSGKKLFNYPYMGDKLKFSDNYAIITDGFYQGAIDQNGKVLVKPEYLKLRKSCPELNWAKTKDGKEGYLDVSTNTFYEIDNLDDFAHPVSTKLIWNVKDGKFGLINREGKEILPYEYKSLRNLHSGSFAVKKEEKYGIVNDKNEIITPYIYDNITQKKIKDIHIIVSLNGKKGIIDDHNNILLPIEYDLLTEDSNNQVKFSKGAESGLLDKNLKPITEKTKVNPVSHNSSKHFETFDENGKKGIKDVAGNIIHEAEFDDLRRYNDTQIEVKKDGLTNMITEKGELIFDEYYDDIHAVGEFAKVKKGKLWGVKTKWGKDIIDIAFENIKIEDGLIITKSGNPYSGVYGLYDYNGVERLKTEYSSIDIYKNVIIANKQDSCMILSKNFTKLFESEGVLRTFKFQDNDYIVGVRKNNKQYLLDLLSMEQSKNGYYAFNEFAFIRNHFRVYSDDEKQGAMDSQENLIIDTVYSEISVIYQNKNYLKLAGPDGDEIYNKKFEPVLKTPYTDLLYRTDNFITAKKDGKEGAIDINGKVVVDFNYREVRKEIEKHYVVRNNNKMGLIDSSGKMKIAMEYDVISEFVFPLFAVSNDKLWGLFDVDSNQKLPIEYQEIIHGTNTRAIVKKDNLYGLISIDGEIIIPLICEKLSNKHRNVNRNFRGLTKPKDRVLLHYNVTYKGHFFELDPDLRCNQNCPPDELLKELGLDGNN